MKIYTKQDLIEKLKSIAKQGWVANARSGKNKGGIGNTLEDLLEIKENNLPIPNASEWELKSQRINTTSLTTLFHFDPSPRAMSLVSQMLLPKYGWKHQQAGGKYSKEEKSFRQTVGCLVPSDRGFMVKIDREQRKVLISFDSSKVDERHKEWLKSVEKRVGLGELNPQPYWGFDDLEHKAGTKLLNCFYVQADTKKENRKEFYWYKKVTMLQRFNFDGFLEALAKGYMFVDFDARSGHNHGTKFRLSQNCLPMLYQKVTEII